MTLQGRLEALAGAIRDKINLMVPRLLPSGGTTGQALVKVDADDYDTQWANVGSVTSITVTQPVSGLTVTNSGQAVTASGSFTLALANDLAALESLTGSGYAKRTATDTWAVMPDKRTIVYHINGGGAPITTGLKGFLQIGFACTIDSWTLLGDVSGSIVVDIWKDTYANAPPTVADVITASAKPTISGATKATSSTLTGWTTSIAEGDVLAFNVNSVASFGLVTLILHVTAT